MTIPSVACPRCDASVPEGARFCMNCGQALGVSESDSGRQARLSGSAPTPLIEKMRTARITGERKPVSALFADVVGSTALAERMDPEDWTAMMNEAFDLMSKAVFRYEGTIAQLQGDAMLAFFGAPVAHEDDPERAVRAALDMISATDEFARQLKVTHGIDFRIRAGVNTGPVVVGQVGTDLRYEYTAMGDAVNVAARMQTAADPGTILITPNTYRFVADTFDMADLGEVTVRGKAEPVRAFRVLGLARAPGRRRGLGFVGLDSPMVGRAAELATLRSLFAVTRAGRGRVAVLFGEPGIGKSRLLAELRTSAVGDDDHVRWIEGRCVSYGQNLPYHLVLDLVRSSLDIPLAASEREARLIVEERLQRLLGADWNDSLPYLAHLLALPLEGELAERARLDPETMQGRYVGAIARVLRALSGSAPVILVCEDVHWADPASVEVLSQLMPLLAQMRVLLIVALRPERSAPGWRIPLHGRELFGEAFSEIQLRPLSDEESQSLVANLLEIESLPARVRDLILARAEGNPFFVEEVIRMLIERGAIERLDAHWVASGEIGSVEIPDTLHGLLLARIDQLPNEAKRSLRVASVIGRQFPVRVLERVLTETTG